MNLRRGRQEGETGKDWREGIVWGRMKESKGGGRKVEGEGGQMEMEERLRREPEAQAIQLVVDGFFIMV